jgi:hypothetical protein
MVPQPSSFGRPAGPFRRFTPSHFEYLPAALVV